MKLTKAHYTIFAIQIIEILGFTLIMPFIPKYASELGASPIQIGMIFTIFSLFQFISAPIMGKLSDTYGRKPMLIISQISTCIGFLILAFSTNLWMIYLSRIVDGLFGSNFTIAQAYLSDITPREEKSKIFAISGVTFGIGLLIAPAIGGVLASINYMIPSLLSALFSLGTIFTTILFLKETVNLKDSKTKKFKFKFFDFDEIKLVLKNSIVLKLLIAFFFFVTSHMLIVNNLSLYSDIRYGFSTRQIGLMLGYVGLLMIIVKAKFMSPLIDKFGVTKLKLFGFFSLAISLFILTFASTVNIYFVAMTFFPIGSGIIRPLIQADIANRTDQTKQGFVMGLTNSLGSISQIIAPMLGGVILNYLDPSFLGIAGFILVLISAVF